jgi:hypothetical protein
MCWHTPVIPATQEAEAEGSQFEASLREKKKKHNTLSKKQTKAKKGKSVAQVVEHQIQSPGLPEKRIKIKRAKK